MRKEIFAGLMLLVVLGCGGKTTEKPAEAAPEPKPAATTAEAKPKAEPEAPPMENDDQRVFFGREQGTQYFKMRGGNEKPRAYYTPSKPEIEKLEAGLPDVIKEALRNQPKRDPPLTERFKTYRRQYIGYVDSGNTRWIWGNYMCVNPGRVGSDRWRKEIIDIDDGGDCFFNFEYSPDTDKFRKFQINGEG